MASPAFPAPPGEPPSFHAPQHMPGVVKLAPNPRANRRIIHSILSDIYATADKADALARNIFKRAGGGS